MSEQKINEGVFVLLKSLFKTATTLLTVCSFIDFLEDEAWYYFFPIWD